MNSQTYLQRKPKSDIAKLFVKVLTRDKSDKPKSGIVPGSEAKLYHVIRRNLSIKNGSTKTIITLECRLDLGKLGHKNCKGNCKTICYHSRAFLDFCLDEAGYRGHWCVKENDANRLHKMIGGTIYQVQSHQNQRGKAWVLVVRK